MSKCKVHEFDPQIYPRKLWVVKGGDVDSLKDMFTQTDGKELDFKEVSQCLAITCNVMMKDERRLLGELIYFTSAKQMNAENISHESAHAAMDILGDIGAEVDIENQEPFAYLAGWIADCIDQVKRDKFK